ncbi:MAG: proline iminopeptidase, partial [Actinomycetota bacterium]|nr:proline iminopeptidase [Actinomycetota bacterium]
MDERQDDPSRVSNTSETDPAVPGDRPVGAGPGPARRPSHRVRCAAGRALRVAARSGRLLRALALLGPGAVTGLVAALAMPRGPVTTAQALLALFLGAIGGLAAGYVARSRWSLASAPLGALVVVEVGRIGQQGITVEGPRLDSTWGIVAFLAGRGVQGLLTGLPMILFAAFGTGMAARRAGGRRWPAGLRARSGCVLRRSVAVATAVALAALAVLITKPASTPPILDSDGRRTPGSIAEIATVHVGGHDQRLTLRGRSAQAPVLLYLEGGPGGSGAGSSRVVFGELEQDFVVAVYEQRGAGLSYPAFEPASTLTLDRAVGDTVEVVQYLRDRFDEQKIYLLGESWGTVLGVLTVQRHPELFLAYLGSGQMVSPRETDSRLYDDVLDYATRTGNDDLLRTMRGYGRPPYDDPLAYALVMAYYEKIEPYDPPWDYKELARKPGNRVGPMGILASEYSLIDKVNVIRGLIDTFAVVYPQLQGIDFRRDVRELDVPVYVLLGDHELRARA